MGCTHWPGGLQPRAYSVGLESLDSARMPEVLDYRVWFLRCTLYSLGAYSPTTSGSGSALIALGPTRFCGPPVADNQFGIWQITHLAGVFSLVAYGLGV